MSGVDPRRLADNYRPKFGIPWVPILPKEQLQKMTDRQLFEYQQTRKQVEGFVAQNPTGSGWTLPAWQRVMEEFHKWPIHVILGGNRCVRGDTPIYDPVLNVTRRIDSIRGEHHVLAWNGSELVVAKASEPFQKGPGQMTRVTLSTGDSFVAAPEHRVLCADGLWRSVARLRIGDELCHPQSTSGNVLSGQRQGARRSTEIQLGSQSDCHSDRHSCDELLLEAQEIAQDAFPSRAGAPTHISASGSNHHSLAQRAFDLQQRNLGVLGRIFSRIPVWRSLYRLSTLDDLRLRAAQFSDTQSRASYTPCKLTLGSHENPTQHADDPRFVAAFRHWKSTAELTQQGKQSCRDGAYVTYMATEGIDVKWDMTVPAYGNYYACGSVHHNSGKSQFAARLCVWALGSIPEAELHLYHVNSDRSKQDQQSYVWAALPQSLKNLPTKRGPNHDVQYRQGGGFTDDKLILPPLEGWTKGGRADFRNYKSFENDNRTAEGFRGHLIWCDEECPVKLFETLKYRTADYHGRIILSFTTVDGWTPLVQAILGKVKTLETRFSKRLNRKLPVLQESLSCQGALIHYFWTEENAFIDTKEFWQKLDGRSEDEVLARAYGIPTKAAKAVFTKFDRTVNVVKHEDLPFIKNPNYPVTRYMSIDPGGSKNWALCWLAIDAAGTWWIYRDWPDFDTYGPWAEASSTIQGKPGPAQTSLGFGIRDYVELIRQLEGKEVIFERLIDPRMGAAEKQSADEGATTIISDLDKHDMTVIPAPGVDIDNGIQGLKDLLAWNPEKPRDSLNSPKLFISDRCENTIHAFCEYTAKAGPEEAVKDFVDGPRYMKVANCIFVAPEDMRPLDGGGSY